MGGDEEDPAVKVIGQLALLSDRLQDIGRTIASASEGKSGAAELGEALGPYLESLRTSLTKTMKKETDGDAVAVAKLSEGLHRVVERLGGLAEAVTTRLAAPAVAPPAPAPPSADLSPYLDKLTAAMASLAEAPRGAEVIQTLDSGVYELLEQMLDKVGDHLLPTVKHIGRRLKGTELEADRALTDQLDRTLKSLDILRTCWRRCGRSIRVGWRPETHPQATMRSFAAWQQMCRFSCSNCQSSCTKPSYETGSRSARQP